MESQDTSRDKRIENVLNAWDNASPAEVSPWLFTRIRQELSERQKEEKKLGSFVTSKLAWAAIILVVLLNVGYVTWTFTSSSKSTQTATSTSEQFIQAFDLQTSELNF